MGLAVVSVVLLALGFTYTNGFHDAANAIATSVSTRALTPRIALALASGMNLLGAFAGVRVAQTIGRDIVQTPMGGTGLAICAAALIGAISWNMLTWWRGLPSSSTHALIGGLVGSAVAAGASGGIHWDGMLRWVLLPMVLSPVVGMVVGYLVMTALLWVFRRSDPARTTRGFRYAQTVSAASVAFGHGMQDAAKAAGIVVLALVASGHQAADDASVPWWVLALTAVVMSIGTYAGGWRIIRTLGTRIIAIRPHQGFAAEMTAASILYVATATGAPISTTQAITSAIMGVGSTRSTKAVRWDVAKSILIAWLLTFPGAGLAAAAAYGLIALVR